MKAIVSVIGKDKKGIIARVSGELFDMDINIEDISQTILQDYFTMIMAVDMKDCFLSFEEAAERLSLLGKKTGVEIRIQSQQIFDAMHKISLASDNI